VLDEGALQRMKFAIGGNSFNRRDASSLILDGQRQTGVDPFPIDKNRAGAAGSLIASLLRCREPENIA